MSPPRTILHQRWRWSVSILALAVAGDAAAETLQDALIAAYGSNAQLRAERSQVEVVDEDVAQARANWRPTVSVTAQEGIIHQASKFNCTVNDCGPAAFGPNPFNTSSNLSPQGYGLTVTQPIFRGGQTVAQTEQALNLVKAERANLVATEGTIFADVIADYMNVVLAKADLDLNLDYERVLRRQLEAAQDRYRIGELTHTDVEQAEAAYAAAIAGRQAAEGTLQIARAAYTHDVGRPPGALEVPRVFPELPADRDEAGSIATVANPTVIQAQFAEEAAEDTVRLVRGQLLPQLSLQASIERDKELSAVRTTEDDEQVVAQLTVPLYEGGAVYSQSRAAQKTVSVRQSQVDDARRVAIQSAQQAWDGLTSARAEVRSLEAAVHANELALKGLQQEASAGSRTVEDILIQEQTLFQTRLNLVQSQHDEIVDQFTLAQSLGRLTAKSLGLPVEYYDPQADFDAVADKWIGFGNGK